MSKPNVYRIRAKTIDILREALYSHAQVIFHQLDELRRYGLATKEIERSLLHRYNEVCEVKYTLEMSKG